MVIEESRPIAVVARQLNVYEATLGNWVHGYRRDCPETPGRLMWAGRSTPTALRSIWRTHSR